MKSKDINTTWNSTHVKAGRGKPQGAAGWEELNDDIPLNKVHVTSEIDVHSVTKEPTKYTSDSISGESGGAEGKSVGRRDERW